MSDYKMDEKGVGDLGGSLPSRNLITRDDLVRLLFSYLDPLRVRFSPDSCRVELSGGGASYEPDTISMETFARPLWGLAPFWAGGGSDKEFEARYARGLANGTNPELPDWWGTCHDYDQKFVEMAAIAFGLMLAPRVLWEPLSRGEKDNVVSWLSQINTHEVWNNNWAFFPVLVNLALKKLGESYDQEAIDTHLRDIDAVWCADGWYTDGPIYESNGMVDYYVAFAYHFYGLIFALCAGEEDPRSKVFLARALQFAGDYVWLFSRRGEGVPYGRSLTYRFAQVAFFSLMVLVLEKGIVSESESTISVGAMKGLILRNLQDWSRLGIVDNAGILSIGYHYPDLHMAEGYNAPGSPYWALKSFALLAIPASSPFWTIRPLPHPVGDGLRMIGHGTMLVHRRLGETTIYVTGRKGGHKFAHTEEKYCKFAYSSRYGFSISVSDKSLKEMAPDSMLVFDVAGHLYVRDRTIESSLNGAEVRASWEPIPGIEVRTTVVPADFGHRRVHEILSSFDCVAYDCGFAVPASTIDEAAGVCEVRQAAGSGLTGEQVSFACEPNTNLMTPKTVIHAVKYSITAHVPTMIESVIFED